MFSRAITRSCARARPALGRSRRAPENYNPAKRRYSSSAGAATVSNSAAAHGALAPFTSELDKIAPSFQINGSQIEILKTPSDFYETLKTKIRKAKRRIFLSTLYIGKSERELIDTIHAALQDNPELQVSILTDALRGTREAPEPSCASLLAPLVEEFGSKRVEIRMYHTPNLTGLRKKHIPKRINEGWGLQHMKLYGIDDEIILSGANLSSDYFTNRQDRYHVFSSKVVTDYFSQIYHGVASLSFLVTPAPQNPAGFVLDWPADNAAPSPLEKSSEYISKSTALLSRLIAANTTAAAATSTDASKTDTTVYMISSLAQLLKPNASTELPAITHILKTLASPQYAGSSWTFTAGYFNPAPSLTKLLLSTSSTNNTVITASPWANGFYQSKGVSGMLPDAYTYLAGRFLRRAHEMKRDKDITLKEWRRGTVNQPEGWTYHAKGLWVTLPQEASPCMTIVGSSNYTKRSYSHDLETGALIVTKDEDLKKRLGDEQKWLQEYAAPVTRDDFASNERRVSIKVRLAMFIVSLVGGAL